MKKFIVILLALMLTLAMAACGGSAPSSGDAPAEESKGSGYSGFGNSFIAESDGAGYETGAEPAEAAQEDAGSAAIGLPGSFNKENVKLIFTANMAVQTLDFDEAEKALYSMVEKAGGYFENITQDNGNYYSTDDSYRYASYTVRVPSDKFGEFIDSVSGGLHVVNMSQNAQDVGQAYFDTERRLETLKNKHDRLEALLSQASTMTDIIELETALSDTEYQIEQFTSDLQRYDSLIDYSTVYVSIEKVSEYSTAVTEDLTFGQRLMRSIQRGASNFGLWVEGIINWIGYYAIQLIILAVIIALIVRFHVFSRIGKLFGVKKKQERYVLIKKGDNKEEEDK